MPVLSLLRRRRGAIMAIRELQKCSDESVNTVEGVKVNDHGVSLFLKYCFKYGRKQQRALLRPYNGASVAAMTQNE